MGSETMSATRCRRNELPPEAASARHARVHGAGLLDLAETIAKRHRTTTTELCGHGQKHAVCRARHELWVAIWTLPGWTQGRVARLWGTSLETIRSGIEAHNTWVERMGPNVLPEGSVRKIRQLERAERKGASA